MSDNDTKSTSEASRSNDGGKSARASEARESVSDKSRDALSRDGGVATKERDTPATAAERAAGQERMAAEGRPTKDRMEREITSARSPTAKDSALGRKDGPAGGPAPETPDQALDLAAISPDRFDAELDAAVAAAEVPAGNTPGADFVFGEPLSEGRQAEILADSAETVATNATRLAEIDATIEARVVEARETRDPAFMDTTTRPSAIPGFLGTTTERFNETRARETISAEFATERAQIEADTQAALNMAALADPANGLNAMRNAAGAALGAADVPETSRVAVLKTGALSETGYARADAFRRAADAWATGSGDMASHPISPSHTTDRYVATNPQNSYIAANLDDILGRLSGTPELAADMRLYATTQLGDAIYNAETGNHGALISQIESGRATSAEALALQTEIAATQPGREALRQLQVLFSPADLANQNPRTGEMQNRGVLNFRPGTPENPMGGYPEVIRNTIGEGINAAMDARGLAGIGILATLAIPGPEDLAIVAGARAIGGLYRGARLGDEAIELATSNGPRASETDFLRAIRSQMRAGAGGGDWPKENVRYAPDQVLRQPDGLSCGPTCARMVAEDRGVPVDLDILGDGLTDFSHLSGGLSDRLSQATGVPWRGGRAADTDQAFDILTRQDQGSWIAELREGPGGISHAIVVDGIDAAGQVRIRDPWDQTMYTMDQDDFLSHWTGGFVARRNQ